MAAKPHHMGYPGIRTMTPDRWQQAKDILQSLVDCEPHERSARLDRICAGDPELRRQLDILLESHEHAQSFLGVSPIKVGKDRTSQFQGKKIGPYQVVSLLGSGGMGEVYKAYDSRLDRTVALKILPADVAGDLDRMRRFVLEAKAASALSHPNVATIYDIGESDGITFIAMEYVDGQTLEEKLKRGPMSAIDIRTIARQIGDALELAHRKGITHRDIKPANLMVTPHGQVKVLDFGLAKISAQAAPGELAPATRTIPGLLMGTVEYMSPEQALGHEVDHRTDIFSLGVVLYRLATGRLPFAGISIGETIDRILHAEPERISRLNPSIPLELERVIERCLEKDRERRYQSAQELLADLREGGFRWPLGRIVTAAIRAKWVIAFGAVGLLVWIATLALILWQRPEKPDVSESNVPEVEARQSNSSTPALPRDTREVPKLSTSGVTAPSQLAAIRLLFPGPGEVIPQNRTDIGCSPDPNRGHGLLLRFRWEPVPGAVSYRVRYAGLSGYWINTTTYDASFELRDCLTFVIDRNLAWKWRVEAFDPAGRLIGASETRSFRYAPCRLSNGEPCSAPPRPAVASSSAPTETPRQAVRLLFPGPDEAIPQTASTGCVPNRGYGELLQFRWEPFPGARSYLLQYAGSLELWTTTKLYAPSFERRNCWFEPDSNLDWKWRVQAFDPDGRLIGASETRRFRWAPCRLSNGEPCLARALARATSPPTNRAEEVTQSIPVDRRTQVFNGRWNGSAYAAIGSFTVQTAGPVDATLQVSGISSGVRLVWLGFNPADNQSPCSTRWLTTQIPSSPYLSAARATWHWDSVPPGSYCLNVVTDLNPPPPYEWTLGVVHP
jgi:serine/threonine protein kinase